MTNLVYKKNAIQRDIKSRLFSLFLPRKRVQHILGIACTGHGASLAYIGADGTVRSSVLDRWTGVKHMMMFSADEDRDLRHPNDEIDRVIHETFCFGFGEFPKSRVFEETIIPWLDWLLGDLGIGATSIDLVVTSDHFFATGWGRLGPRLRRWFPSARIFRNIEHHEIHQRQAFWQSGFEEAAVLTLDGCGEDLDRLGGRKLGGTIGVMNDRGDCQVLKELLFPLSSVGTTYHVITDHVGFRLGQEGKTMGLAPYGEPEFFEQLREHLHLYDNGGFEFVHHDDLMPLLEEYTPKRQPGEELTARHMNVAYAGQAVVELVVTNAFRAALELGGSRNLVYAGGVALNSVANEKARRVTRPDRLYIATNPGDAGMGLGCALYGAYELAEWDPPRQELPEYLGPPYFSKEIDAAVQSSGFPASCPDEIEPVVARCIANGYIVARYDGKAEFGPRALGNRSIVCDPRRADMKDYLNARVKHREGFRPFAPSVLEGQAGDWFDLFDKRYAYMLCVVPVRPEKQGLIPAVIHVDGTARLQTVSYEENPGYWRLITEFYRQTGIPLVLNTSFNIAGRPIVEKPEDALVCFKETEIDLLMLGPWVVSKRPLDEYLAHSR